MGVPHLKTRGRLTTIKNNATLPKQQLFILGLCRISEPIAFMSVFPYIYFMISSFNITTDDGQIAIYAGLVTSAFAFAEFLTGMFWGNLSDKWGRKPILIGGLIGTAISMIIFGFSRNLPMALLGRALGGLLNGNIGVLQTTVAEMITVKEHQPRAFAVMPFVWCLGSVIGPALGGALAQPCLSYPTIFPRNTIWDRFPFLLPNVVCVLILLCGVTIGILFLEETHVELKHTRKDYGLEAGAWILKHFQKRPKHVLIADKHESFGTEEVQFLLEDEAPPGYRTTEGSPRMPSSRASSPATKESERVPLRTQDVFTKQVLLHIGGYGILAYISFDQLMPVFLSSDISTTVPSLPFKFRGGFALTTKTIGILLAVQGLYSMAAQLLLFPKVSSRFGNLNTFRFVIMTWPLLYLLVPYLVFLPPQLQMYGVMFCLLWKITLHVMAFPSNNILVSNSAPSSLVLGRINGAAASTASLARAFGPTITGLIHSRALAIGYSGLAWWACGLICTLGAIESLWMKEGQGRLETAQDDNDEEAAMREAYIDPLAIDAAISAVALQPGRIMVSNTEQ